MRILIADDNRSLGESIAALLRARGADTSVVFDGRAAVDELARETFDVLLVDSKLPGLAGPEVLAQADGTRTRLLAMTGYDTGENIDRARAAGAEHVFRKPFPLPELFERLGLRAGAPPTGYDFMRVVVLGASEAEVATLAAVCAATHLASPEAMRRAVAEAVWDAAVVTPAVGDHELVEDSELLDEDLAIVRSAAPERVIDAVQRTGDRRRRTELLEEVQETIERAPVALLVAQGLPPRLRRWNLALEQLLGFRASELGEVRLEDLQGAGPDSVPLLDLIARSLAAGAAVKGTVCLRTLAEGERCFAAEAYPVGGQEAIAVALTPRRSSDEHAEALRLLGATAAGVAHEMRNTLGGVSGSLGLLAARVEPGGEAAEILQQTRDRVARASHAMADLLDFARPVVLRLRIVPVRMLLDSAAGEIRDDAAPDLQVEVDVADDGMRILADPTRVQMALVDLGRNARQALGDAGRIVFGCRRVGSWVELSVEDDGPGVPEAVGSRIFEPFFTTRPEGSGLGLANVRKLAEAHGGSVSLGSEGGGARFVIRLPTRPRGAAP